MLPPLLERNPDLKKSLLQYALLQYATSNLNELTAELLLAYLHDTALPALLEEFREELESPDYPMYELLQEHRLTKLSMPTIYRWMRILGFKYEPRKSATTLMATRNLRRRRTERNLLEGILKTKS